MFAIIALLLLHIVALGLLWAASRRPRALAAFLAAYGVMIMGVIVHHTGLIAGPTAASQLPPPASLPSVSSRQCREILTLLSENRVILEPPTAERLVVAGAIWIQIPEQVRSQVVSCVEQMRPTGALSRPVEVVER